MKLQEYISNLPYDEIIDLCAMMDCGRECSQRGIRANIKMFTDMREDFYWNHKCDNYLASYLISKSELDVYLRHALKIYK